MAASLRMPVRRSRGRADTDKDKMCDNNERIYLSNVLEDNDELMHNESWLPEFLDQSVMNLSEDGGPQYSVITTPSTDCGEADKFVRELFLVPDGYEVLVAAPVLVRAIASSSSSRANSRTNSQKNHQAAAESSVNDLKEKMEQAFSKLTGSQSSTRIKSSAGSINPRSESDDPSQSAPKPSGKILQGLDYAMIAPHNVSPDIPKCDIVTRQHVDEQGRLISTLMATTWEAHAALQWHTDAAQMTVDTIQQACVPWSQLAHKAHIRTSPSLFLLPFSRLPSLPPLPPPSSVRPLRPFLPTACPASPFGRPFSSATGTRRRPLARARAGAGGGRIDA